MSFWDDAESGGTYVRPMYVKLAGDLVSGVLLSQLAYWFRPGKNGKTKLKVQLEGKFWLAKTREELCEECCMSADQLRRALDVLKKKGFLETQVRKFAGLNSTHFWLNVKAMETEAAKWGSSLTHNGDNPNLPTGDNPQPQMGIMPSSYTETTDSDYQETTVTAGDDMKAEDVLKLKAAAVKLYPNTPTGVAQRWQNRLGASGFQKALTAKQKAQLKQVLTVAGDKTGDLIDFVTHNWSKFAIYVRDKHGWSKVDMVPSPGFLLTHVDLGLQLIAEPDDEQDEAPKPKVKYVYAD